MPDYTALLERILIALGKVYATEGNFKAKHILLPIREEILEALAPETAPDEDE